MRSHIDWKGKRSISYKGVETSPEHTRFKNLEGKLERKSSKRTISVNGVLGKNPKVKVQKRQYLLAVGLNCDKNKINMN